MTWLELQMYGVGSTCSTNWAKTTKLFKFGEKVVFQWISVCGVNNYLSTSIWKAVSCELGNAIQS